jgi:hypothetical protein
MSKPSTSTSTTFDWIKRGVGLLVVAATVLLALHWLMRGTPWKAGLLFFMAPLWDVLVFFWIAVASTVLGARVLDLLDVWRDKPASYLVSAAAIGLAIHSQLVMVLALLRLINISSLVVILALPLFDRAQVAKCWRLLGPYLRLPQTPWGWALAAIFLVYLVFALGPPAWIDPLTYHLELAKQYLLNEGVPAKSRSLLAFTPSGGAMLYVIGMGLGSEFVPKLVNFGLFLLLFAGLSVFANEFFGRKGARLGLLLFAGQWVVQHGVQRANVDFHTTLYCCLAFTHVAYLLLAPRDGEQKTDRRPTMSLGHAIVAGVLLGGAVASKYTALYAVLGIETMLLLALISKRASFFRIILLNVTVGLVFMPTMIRNWIYTKDPLFWFLSPLLGNYDLISASQFEAMPHISGLVRPKMDALTLVMGPIWAYFDGRFPSTNFDGLIDPFYLIFGPLALFFARKHRPTAILLLFLVVFYPFWLASGITRYAMPAIALMSLMTGSTMARLADWIGGRCGRILDWSFATLIAIYVASTVLAIVSIRRHHLTIAVPCFMRLLPRSAYLANLPSGDIYAMGKLLEKRGPASDGVFMIWSTLLYDLKNDAKSDSFATNVLLLMDAYHEGQSPEQWLRKRGYRYVLLDISRYTWYKNSTKTNPKLAPYPEAEAFLDRMFDFVRTKLMPRLKRVRRGRYHVLFEVPNWVPPRSSGRSRDP